VKETSAWVWPRRGADPGAAGGRVPLSGILGHQDHLL